MMLDLGLGNLRLEDHLCYATDTSAEYGPPAGAGALREAIAAREGVDVRQVVITTGASLGLVSVLATLPGRFSMLCPRPFYPAYRRVSEILGIDLLFYEVGSGQGNVPDDEALAGTARSDTRALLWNFPHNPTGSVAATEVTARVAAWAERAGIAMISDEVYADFVYETALGHAGPGTPLEDAFRLRSFSKAYGIPGARIGYVIASPRKAAAVARAHWALGMSPPASGQALALALLTDRRPEQPGRVRTALMDKRDRALDIVRTSTVVQVDTPSAGVFLWLRIAGPGGRSRDLAVRSSEAGVLVTPGAAFGVDDPTFLRTCFAVRDDVLAAAFGRLVEVLEAAPTMAAVAP